MGDDDEIHSAFIIAFAIKLPKKLSKESAIAQSRIRRAGKKLNQMQASVDESLLNDLADAIEHLQSLVARAKASSR